MRERRSRSRAKIAIHRSAATLATRAAAPAQNSAWIPEAQLHARYLPTEVVPEAEPAVSPWSDERDALLARSARSAALEERRAASGGAERSVARASR